MGSCNMGRNEAGAGWGGNCRHEGSGFGGTEIGTEHPNIQFQSPIDGLST